MADQTGATTSASSAMKLRDLFKTALSNMTTRPALR